MRVLPTRAHIDQENTGEGVALSVLADELMRLGVQDSADAAKRVLSALKSGSPRLAIIQQGRMEELNDALEELRQANERLEREKNDSVQQEAALTDLIKRALTAMEKVAS